MPETLILAFARKALFRPVCLRGEAIHRDFYSQKKHQGHNAFFLRALGVFVVIIF